MATTILIAEDDAGYRFPIVNLFEDEGYQVEQATNHAEGIAKARDCSVWVIDVRLPTSKMEGIQAVQDLVAEGAAPRHPVIFISVLPQSLASAKLAGLEDAKVEYQWLEKPFEPELLLQRVEGLLGQEVG